MQPLAADRPTAPPRRRTQQERSEATRTALLDAAIEILVEKGYANATTGTICERAGLSRGAHLHHFGTRDGLLAAALTHLAARMVEPHLGDAGRVPRPPGSGDDDHGLQTLWSLYTGPVFAAVIDVMVAARTDPVLAAALAPLERTVGRQTLELCRVLFPEHAARADFEDRMTFVLSAIRGVAMLDVTSPGSDRRLARWDVVRAGLLAALRAPGAPAAAPLAGTA